MLRALAGIGLPRAGGESPLDDARIEAAASLAHQVEGPERLAGFLVGAFGVPVSVVEWVGAWTPVPDGLQSRLGAAHARLGDGATIGPRVFQRHTRVELRVGPLDLRTFTAFAPGGPRLPSLLRAVRETAGDAIDVDIRLVLREGEVPPARVGASRLGLTGWLPRPKGAGDAGDLVLRTATGFRPDERRRAA
jgi:type VI secretion system protein ImpH